MAQIICDGEFEIVKITEDLYDQAVELYQKHFMKYENVSIATNLLGSQESIDEMEMLIRAILRDGISFAAVHRETKEMVSMSCNKILGRSSNVDLDKVIKKFKSPSMQCVGQFLAFMETSINIYEKWQIESIVEIVFLSTRKDFGQRGLALKLSEYTMEYCRKMLNGTLPETENLPKHVRGFKPQAVTSLFTSLYTQKIGEKLGMESIYRVPFTHFTFEGKTFAEKIDPIHVDAQYAASKL